MKKLLNMALSVNQLRKTIGYNMIIEAMRCDLRLKIVDNPNQLLNSVIARDTVPKQSQDSGQARMTKNNILILSPHPDDDVFGCGGVIIEHIKNGDKVNIVYFSDGSHGIKTGKRDLSLINTRHEEAQKSAEILGVDLNNLFFLDNEDGKLTNDKKTVNELRELIKKIKPQIIYLPSILDDNPDHRAVNKIFYKVLSCCHSEPTEESLSNILIVMYEIWTPILPNRIINITNEVDIKTKAMQAHQSQLTCRDYCEGILALNKYRATLNNISGFAEGFFICSPKIYKTFFKNCPV